MDTKYSLIIRGLLEKSMKREVNWIQSGDVYPQISPNSDDFIVNFEKSSINIYRNLDDPDEIILSIKNSKGKDIYFEKFRRFDTGFLELDKIITLAAKKANKVDDTIESILTELNSIGEIGFESSSDIATDDIPF